VVKKGWMRFSFCLIWVCCYVHGPRIRGERGTVRAGLPVEGLEVRQVLDLL